MTSLNVGDLVELHPGAGWLGTVLDVVESRPRWLLVYWHTPPNICINPLLENEEFLTSAVEDARRAEHAGALIEPRWLGFSKRRRRQELNKLGCSVVDTDEFLS